MMCGPALIALGQQKVSGSQPGSEPEAHGTGLCGYILPSHDQMQFTPLKSTVRALDGIVRSGEALLWEFDSDGADHCGSRTVENWGHRLLSTRENIPCLSRDIEKDGLKDMRLPMASASLVSRWHRDFCVICSATVIGIMWRMILHSNIGFITAALQSMGLGKINFMNTPGLTIFVISFISIWRSFGISTIIYVTAIQQVSPSLFEAAQMDGAGKILQFLHITVPSIRPTFWYIMMTRFAGALQIFDIIYVTTNGGPNYTTESTVSYIYSRAFSSNSSMGYASAMSVVLFIIIMFITVLMYRRMVKED